MTKQEMNLSFNQIKKENAKTYKNKKRIHFDNGAKLDIDVVFQPTKQEAVIQELLTLLFEIFKRGQKLETSSCIGLATVLIIKYFTSLETDSNDIDSYTELLVELKDGNYFDKIIEALDEEQLNKTLLKVEKSMRLLSENIKKLDESDIAKIASDSVAEDNG